VLSQSSFRAHVLARICKTLRVLFDAYYFAYKYPPMRTCLDYQYFSLVVPRIGVLGFSAEAIAFRATIEDVMSGLTQDGRSLDLQMETG